MSNKFAEYTGLNLSDINKEILKRWDEGEIFQKSLEIRQGAESFVFYEGPPSANGMPGIHHVIARSIKDIFCRYKTMKGYLVERKAGWDTHGLPVELGVEKALGITKEDIGKSISVADYNAACRKDVMKYTKEWEDLTRIMGYWVDMKNPYITYDSRYIESLWWLLKQLHSKERLYKGYSIQPYSPAAGTGLSTHELNQPGCYKDVKDTTCIAQFKIKSPKPEMSTWGDAYFLAWTTTPWTLPSNTALCLGPNISYVAVRTYNPYTGMPMTGIVAKDLVASLFNAKAADLALEDFKAGDKLIPFQTVGEWMGQDLEGMEYEQLIPWINTGEGAFKVITGDFVTTENGTGIVHIAPTFGADDDRVAKAKGVPPLMLLDKEQNQRPMVDLAGKYFKIEDLDADFVKANMNVGLYKEYAGRFVKNAYDDKLSDSDPSLDVDLCVMLKMQNLAFKIEKYTHSYPHCWRTDKPVLYYPLDSWFVRTTAARERMIELNNTIKWKPESTGTGRFGKWLENLQDWNLSRSRYWGTPLPIWRTEDGTEEICIGSLAELYAEMEKSIAAGLMDKMPFEGFEVNLMSEENYNKIDLHRPYVDDIILASKDGNPMRRELDLIDVWFDSGAMPYAQIHYPFENKEVFDNPKNNSETVYPADFIAEGVDQTRGWFFTLHALGCMIFDNVAFKAVISNGMVLDKKGNKMSKRLGNAVDPFEAIEQYGSDPLRWYMISNASPWDNLKFDTEGIEEARRKFFGTLYNTYSFFALYANVDGFEGFDNQADNKAEKEIVPSDRPEIDQWIISLLNTLILEVDEYYASYEPTRASRAISEFVNDHLSNWYVRLNRKRFWGGTMDKDKFSAYQTLYLCLETVAKLMAPIAPFYSDKLFCDLIAISKRENVASVHLSHFPVCKTELIDKKLEEHMKIAQSLSSMVLALRRKVSIKVRQPLSKIMIPLVDAQQKEAIEAIQDLILNEVNVKEIQFIDDADGILVKRIKPDFKKLGPRYGKIMKELALAVAQMDQSAISELEREGVYTVQVSGQTAEISLADVEIISEDIPGCLVANEGRLTLALDINISEELRREGLARELVNRIQNIRKATGLEIVDKIKVKVQANNLTDAAFEEFKSYIAKQILASDIEICPLTEGECLDFDEFQLFVQVEKI
ncbi:isoleucine--tRNA ligase [Bacteroidales bacterium]|nr:isoleucine--tRNA ligase [Bacteroidales bacterium]